MKSKKASILPENTLSIVLAVIGLALVFTAAWMIYKGATLDPELESAQSRANAILAKVQALEQGQQTKMVIQGISHTDDPWYLAGWGTATSITLKPEKCFFNACICVCKRVKEDLITNCQDNGFCRDIGEIEKVSVLSYTINLGSSPESSRIDVGPIPLEPQLLEIEIDKTYDPLFDDTENILKMKHYTKDYRDNYHILFPNDPVPWGQTDES